MRTLTNVQKSILLAMALLGWFGLIGQFVVFYKLDRFPLSELIIQYFTFFTVLTNILVALSATMILWKPDSFFSRQSVQTAIAGYIFIVSLIYNTILRFLWHPQGLHKVVDELLHLIIPILFILYWALYSTRAKLKWTSIVKWQLYPLVYICWVFIRAQFSGFYPYPFLDLQTLGVEKVMINCIEITVLFVLTSFVFVGIGNYIVKRRTL